MTEITGDSPQAVAYALTRDIAVLEGKDVDIKGSGADRAYVLGLYKDCLQAVLSLRKWGPYSG